MGINRKQAVMEVLEPRLLLNAETLAAMSLPDQVISHTQGQLVMALPDKDAQGDVLSYSASIRTPAAEASALRERLSLSNYAQQYDNWLGRGEKWFQDVRGAWHYLLGDGRMCNWSNSAVEGQIDAAYYADPQSLLGVQAGGTSAVAVGVSGNQLTITPPADFLGRFLVDLTASDGAARATSSFSVTVTNHAPELDVADVTMSHRQSELALALATTDVDGDAVSYTATVAPWGRDAYALKQRLGLTNYVSQYDNWSGRGEKWLTGQSGAWFTLMPDGRLMRWGGGLEGQVGKEYYDNPQLLLGAQPPSAPDVTVRVQGGRLLIDPANGYAGKFEVRLSATDGLAETRASFSVDVTNSAPVLALSDQTMPHTQDKLTLTLPAADADGDIITYTAAVKSGDANAYNLKQRLGLASYVSQYDNWSGRGEKWLQDSRGGWFYMISDGSLYNYAGGRLEGRVDASYYANPLALINVEAPQPVDIPVTISGNLLTIDPPNGFMGKFNVDVTASDGVARTTGSFAVTVTNSPPVLALSDQTMPHTQDKLTLTLPAADADGDIITYTAAVKSGDANAYNLKQRLGLASYVSQYDNWSGRGEKWLQDSRGGWFYMTRDGSLYNYAGGRLEGRVDASYYANPLTLINIQAPQPVTIPVTLAGNQVTIDPPANYAGKFAVAITASDGLTQTAASFYVTVTNAAPVLSIADQTMPATQDKLVLSLPATDADGDTVTYTALLKMPATQAYELKTQLGLAAYAPQFNNWLGRADKWLSGAGGAWFYMLADGKVYQYSTNKLEGQVDAAYYANPQQLITVQPAAQADVAVSILGSQVTIDPANGFYGRLQVQVTASDGVAAPVTATFGVTVLPLNDPTTYTPGATVATRVVQLASGMEFVVLGTDQADTLVLSQAATTITLTTKAGSTDYAGNFTTVTIYGFGGNDTIRTTHSVTAGVTIRGGDGNDSMFVAGTGAAKVYGDAGDDLVVTVGGGAATTYGGDGLDSFWGDGADRVADTSAAETAAAGVHTITRFYQPTTDPNKAVSLEIDGQDIVDPNADYIYRSFTASPLFVDGPEYNDIRQGAVGDCYFMAALASLAQSDPMAIKQMIAPMGDGSYAVRFYNGSGQANYVRVDAALPASGMTPAYARLSPDGELWVALAEKAYAQFRTGANSYASLNSGWMEPVYKAVTNALTGTVYTTIASLADYLTGKLNAGNALTCASVSNPVGPAVGGHAYMIKTVETTGGTSYVTVYNPWGFDGTSWDSNSGDGLMRMSLATFTQNFFAVSYCAA